MDIKPENVIDLLDQQLPALSSTNDMPVIETKPDATPEPTKEQKAEAAPEKAETPTESATVDTEEEPGAAEGKKPPRGVQKRLDELTKQREEANRRAEALQASLDAALALAKKPEVKEEIPELKQPARADFEDPAEWEAAVIQYASDLATQNARQEIQKSLAERERLQNEEAQLTKQRQLQEAYKGRIETTKSKYADFEEVAERADVSLPMPVVRAILTQEDGPDIQYYFGKNPDEAKRFLEMQISGEPDVMRQLYELGKISASLKTPKPSLSNAPPPLTPHKPGATSKAKDPSEESMDEYVARRKKESGQAVRH